MNVYKLVRELMEPRRPVFGSMDGDIRLPRQPVGFDDPGVESFYRFLRAKGLKVKEVPQSYLLKRFPKAREADAIGYTTGEEVFVASDYRGKMLPPDKRIEVAAHEYGHAMAGEGERKAQQIGIDVLRKLGYEGALRIAKDAEQHMSDN